MMRTNPAISQAREMSMSAAEILLLRPYPTLGPPEPPRLPQAPCQRMSGLAGREHQGLQHLAARAVLHEGGDPGVPQVRARQQRQRTPVGELQSAIESDRAQPLAHDEIVLEPLAAVLPGGHVACELV